MAHEIISKEKAYDLFKDTVEFDDNFQFISGDKAIAAANLALPEGLSPDDAIAVHATDGMILEAFSKAAVDGMMPLVNEGEVGVLDASVEINGLTFGTTFARPSGEDVSADDISQAFGFSVMVPYSENFDDEIREYASSLYTAGDDDGEDEE